LQELLPFVPLLRLAQDVRSTQHKGSISSDEDEAGYNAASDHSEDGGGPLLGQLPPSQRAWLLADVAAALLLPEQGGWWVSQNEA
jgi:hypothetical protein